LQQDKREQVAAAYPQLGFFFVNPQLTSFLGILFSCLPHKNSFETYLQKNRERKVEPIGDNNWLETMGSY